MKLGRRGRGVFGTVARDKGETGNEGVTSQRGEEQERLKQNNVLLHPTTRGL